MALFTTEWKERIEHWIRVLSDDFYTPVGEINWKAGCTAEQLSYEEGKALAADKAEPGFTWGNEWEYGWFLGNICLPEETEGKMIVMDLNPQGESTIFVNGKSFGTYRAEWVKIPHHFMEDNVLTKSAKPGESFEILMETYAGHFGAKATDAGCSPGPILPGSYKDSAVNGARRTMGTCTYGIWDEDAYQLYMDVSTLSLLLETMDEDSLRASKIADALEAFTLAVDFEQPKEKRTEDYIKARELLKPVLSVHNGPTMPEYYAIGNAHIDLAWLWPMAETYRKTSRTFAAQLRHLEEYPDYKFIQSQPAAYEMCRKYYPELFECIKDAVKEGRWIAEGAMWVEPDTNMAGGEALVRQLLYGKKYFKDEFGVDSELLWLPDTFGYSAALPQILKKSGVKYLVTQKIFWSYNKGEQFPYHYFSWKGLDGSEVTSFLPTSYTFRTDPKTINMTWKNRVQKRELDAYLLPFGYGDGGGGPSRDYMEYIERQKDIEGGVKVRMEDPRVFFRDMDAKGGPSNTYDGELYFAAHRGTYTSQAKTKWYNRKCELALRELELWGALAAWKYGTEYPAEKISELWKEVLLHQFHDILPGSSIQRVYTEAEERLQKVLDETCALTAQIKESLETAGRMSEEAEGSVVIWNSLGFEREALVTLPEAFRNGAVDKNGRVYACTETEEGLQLMIKLEPFSAAVLMPAEEKQCCPEKETDVRAVEKDGNIILENNKVRAVINRNGEVISYILKESGREFAAEPMNRMHFYKDVPRKYDAWDIDSNYVDQEIEGAVETCAVLESCSRFEAVVAVRGNVSDSSYIQKIRLEADSTRLTFETEADWKELHRMLKVGFPVNVLAQNGYNEIQFGYIERPAHRSRQYDKDRFEVCNHRYSALCDQSHGAAVLNDCKYGISMNVNSMELTLLRAAACPEMRADNTRHSFVYAFCGYEGSFAEGEVLRQGYELNVPVKVTAGSAQIESSFASSRPNVVIETVKPAENNSSDMILRVYEGLKAAGKAVITCNIGKFRAYECDMLENEIEEIPVEGQSMELDFKAFEIKTIRLKKE